MKQLYYKILENIEALLMGLFIIILPAIYFKKVIDPVLFPRYLALSIWVLVMLFLVGYRIWKSKFEIKLNLPHKIILGSAGLFVLLNVISSFSAVNTSEAVFKTFKEFTLMLSFIIFFLVLRNNEKTKDIVIKSFILASLIFIGIAVKQMLDADFTQFKAATSDYGYWFRQATAHVKSTLSGINLLASFLYLSLAFSIYGSIFYRKVWRILSILAVLGAFVFIFIVSSKATFGALGLSFVAGFILILYFIFYYLPKKSGKKTGFWSRYLIGLLPFVFIISCMYLFEKTELGIVKVVKEKVGQVLNPDEYLNTIYSKDNPTSAQTRTLVWSNTLNMAKDNPVLGVGPGQWRIIYPKYGLDVFGWEIRNGRKLFQRTHNDFLWILGEVGFSGLIVFLVFFVGTIFIAFRNIRSSNDIKTTLLNGLLFSILIGFMVNLFVSFPRERITHNVTYLLMLALILDSLKYNAKTIKLKNKVVLLGVLVLIVLTGYNLSIANDMFAGDKAAVYFQAGTIRNNIPIMARGVRKVKENSYYTLDPFSVPVAYYNGTVLQRQNKLNEALKAYEEAYVINPYHLLTLCNLGTAYNHLSNNEKSIEFYSKALAISPRFEEALVAFAIVKYQQGKTLEGLDVVRKIPINTKRNPVSFKKTYLTICKKRAIEISNKLNLDNLKLWLKDENKINATFVKFQKQNGGFDKILLEELGK